MLSPVQYSTEIVFSNSHSTAIHVFTNAVHSWIQSTVVSGRMFTLRSKCRRRRRRQRVVVEDRSVTPEWPSVVDLLQSQLVACCCCHCVAGQSISCWDDLGDASSFGRGDGRESDRHDTGVLVGLACLQEALQCDRRRSSGGVWWDPTPDLDAATSQFLMWSCKRILVIWRWHFMWKASKRRSSAATASTDHVSKCILV